MNKFHCIDISKQQPKSLNIIQISLMNCRKYSTQLNKFCRAFTTCNLQAVNVAVFLKQTICDYHPMMGATMPDTYINPPDYHNSLHSINVK